MKLRFLIALPSAFPNCFIPLPLPPPYRKISEDQEQSNAQKNPTNKATSNFYSRKFLFLTQEHAKEWQKKKEETIKCLLSIKRQSRSANEKNDMQKKPYSLGPGWSPDHKHSTWGKQAGYLMALWSCCTRKASSEAGLDM